MEVCFNWINSQPPSFVILSLKYPSVGIPWTNSVWNVGDFNISFQIGTGKHTTSVWAIEKRQTFCDSRVQETPVL